jgi:hypothetical protein
MLTFLNHGRCMFYLHKWTHHIFLTKASVRHDSLMMAVGSQSSYEKLMIFMYQNLTFSMSLFKVSIIFYTVKGMSTNGLKNKHLKCLFWFKMHLLNCLSLSMEDILQISDFIYTHRLSLGPYTLETYPSLLPNLYHLPIQIISKEKNIQILPDSGMYERLLPFR